MTKYSIIAYALWLVGSWFGLHHLYLNRPHAAFLSTVTLNGWGVAWLHDMLAIPTLVSQANANQEYIEKQRVDRKFSSQPSFSILSLVVQIFAGSQFGTIASCLLPVGLSPVVYEVLFCIGAACGINLTGEVMNPETKGAFKWVLATIAVILLPSFWYDAFDYEDEDYRSTKLVAVFAGMIAFVATRSWADERLLEAEANQTDGKPTPRTVGSVKTWLTYWGYIALFVTAGITALSFHGDVTVHVNGEKVDMTFFEACENVIHSEAFEHLWSTLYSMYNGTQHEESYEKRWERFSSDLDVSGRRRYLKVLHLPNDATEKDIKAAYRRLVLQWHPDKYTGNDREHANAMFYKIQDAYEKLVAMENTKDEL